MEKKLFKDYYPNDSEVLFNIQTKLMKLYKSLNYKYIEPSSFLELNKQQIFEQDKSFKFIHPNGKIYSLRTEYTLQVSNIVSNLMKDEDSISVFYLGKAYQFLVDNAGELNEYIQAGIERFDNKYNIYSDIQVIAIAIESLKSLGISKFKIDIGDVTFFKGLANEMEIDETNSETLCRLIDRKDYIGIENFLMKLGLKQNIIERFSKLTRLYAQDNIFKEARKFSKSPICKESIEKLEEIYLNLEKLGYKEYISIDFGLLKHLNYYTGIIFSGYLNELGYPVLSGGRYDNLCSTFGKKYYAVGFAIGVDRILEVMLKNKKKNIIEKYYKAIAYDNNSFAEAFLEFKKNKSNTFLFNTPITIEDAIKSSGYMNVKRLLYFENGIKKSIELGENK